MTVSTVSNDYAKKQLQSQIRNYKKLDKEKTVIRKGENRTKRKHTRQIIRKGYILTSQSRKEKTAIRRDINQTKRTRIILLGETQRRQREQTR